MKSSFTRRSWPTPARRLTLIVAAGVDTLLYSKALDRRLALFKSNAVSPPKVGEAIKKPEWLTGRIRIQVAGGTVRAKLSRWKSFSTSFTSAGRFTHQLGATCRKLM